jgi:hypothetical protein
MACSSLLAYTSLTVLLIRKKATYLNAIFIAAIKENLSRFLITYIWFTDIFSKLALD